MRALNFFFALVLGLAFFLPAHNTSLAAEKKNSSQQVEKSGDNTAISNLSRLSPEELAIYQYGEISTGSLIGGGLLGTFVGFGTGHIVYGKYGQRGWIFTVGEVGTIAMATVGAAKIITSCLFDGSSSGCSTGSGLFILGGVGFFGFRLWELIDVWTIPGSHNDRYRSIKAFARSEERRVGKECRS